MNGAFRALGLATALALGPIPDAAAADAGAAGLGAAAVARLEAGEVLFEALEPRGGSGVALRATGVVDASPVAVWPVLRDCQHYEAFLPGVRRSRLLDRKPGSAVCYAEIDLPFPLGTLRSEVRTDERSLPGLRFERRWSLLRGDYRRIEGSWTLGPWGEGARTLAVYQVDLDPRTVVPDFLLRRAQERSVPRLFAAIRERVRTRAPRTGLAPGPPSRDGRPAYMVSGGGRPAREPLIPQQGIWKTAGP